MQRKWIMLGAALAAALPGVLAAQRRRVPRAPRDHRASRAPTPLAYSDHHGRIGVIVNTEPDSQTDKIGAKLEAVTPGGPAAKAGSRSATYHQVQRHVARGR